MGFATISSQIDSLRDWPYTALPASEVALAGFYHDPTEENPATVTCFSCDAVWPVTRTTGRYSKNEVQTILLDYHADNCLWAEMLRNAMGRDLIKLPENTTKEDREHHLGFEKPCETANENKSSVNLSFQIN